VRSLLAPTRFFAEEILYPQGLDNLIDSIVDEGNGTVNLHLNNRIPLRFIYDDIVRHLAWLYFDDDAREAWEKVYRSIVFNQNDNKKLSTVFPKSGKATLKGRVIKNKNTIVFLELLELGELSPPFSEIEYSHDSLYDHKKSSNGSNTGRTLKVGQTDNHSLDDNDTPVKTYGSPAIIENIPTVLKFTNTIKTIPNKRTRNSSKGNGENGLRIIKDNDADLNTESLVCTIPSSGGGVIKQADFTAPNVQAVEGLDKFLTAIHILKKFSINKEIIYEINNLPSVGPFAFLENGTPRKYALVKVKNIGVRTNNILEVALPDNRYLSTLVYWGRNGELKDEELFSFVNKITWSLVKNNGSWDSSFLRKYSEIQISKMRHVKKQSSFDWAMRMREKLKL